jgi:hypothetical protein
MRFAYQIADRVFSRQQIACADKIGRGIRPGSDRVYSDLVARGWARGISTPPEA